MSRIINPEGPGKIRNHAMRTCAEILRRLSQKPQIDEEAKDMTAHLVFSLREINGTIEHSAEAWENRDYWMKAEELRRNWSWAPRLARDIEKLVRDDEWDSFPEVMVLLFQHFGEISVKKFMRSPDTWEGSYQRLLEE